jgi:hypothetical protein
VGGARYCEPRRGPSARPGSVHLVADDLEVPVTDVLPIVLIGLLAVGALPIWPWSRGWGWAPFGIVAIGLATLVLFRLAIVPEA